jgi:hypothetical protein
MTKRTTIFALASSLVLLLGLYVFTSLHTQATNVAPVLVVPPNGGIQNETINVYLDGFVPGEGITLWQTFPDYTVLPIYQQVSADSAGRANVTLFIDPSVPVGTHFLSARGNTSDAIAIASFPIEAPELVIKNSVAIELVESGQTQGNPYVFAGSGYIPSEPVALWLTFPDGSVRDLQIVDAGDGSFTYRYTPSAEDPIGTYQITAFGRSSERTAITSFVVEVADYLATAEPTTLEVFPPQARQLDIVTMTGRGFDPGEVVSLWLTLPDGSVVTMYEGVTLSGAFQERVYLPAVIPEGGLPVGIHHLSAYGSTSGRRAIASFELLPGNEF